MKKYTHLLAIIIHIIRDLFYNIRFHKRAFNNFQMLLFALCVLCLISSNVYADREQDSHDLPEVSNLSELIKLDLSDNNLFGGIASSDFNSYSTSILNDFFEVENDSLPPSAEFIQNCSGDIIGVAYDEPRYDEENRSNLAEIYMMTEDSYNYNFIVDEFISGEDYKVNWKLDLRNNIFNGRAHLVFIDKAGNRTDTIITYQSMNSSLSPTSNDLGTLALEEPNIEQILEITYKNEGENTISDEYDVNIVFDSDADDGESDDISIFQNFEFVDFSGIIPTPIEAGEEFKFKVKFTAREIGNFRDSIGVMIIEKESGDVCKLQYLAELKAKVGSDDISLERENTDPYQVCESSSIEIGNDIKILIGDNEVADDENYSFEWINLGENYGNLNSNNSKTVIFQSNYYIEKEDRFAKYRLIVTDLENTNIKSSIEITIKINKRPFVDVAIQVTGTPDGSVAKFLITSRTDWIYKFYKDKDSQDEITDITKTSEFIWTSAPFQEKYTVWIEAYTEFDKLCKNERLEVELIPTSVDDEISFQDNSIDIYPNPASENIELKIIELPIGKYTLNVVNILGQIIFTSEIENLTEYFSTQMDISKYESGSYVIQLSNANIMIKKKFLIAR